MSRSLLTTQSSSCITGQSRELLFTVSSNTRSNIDRLFAIYQALNPDAWFNHSPAVPDDPTDPSSAKPLYPFRKAIYPSVDQWDYYTSDDIRNHYTLNYDYDILVPKHGETRGSKAYCDRIKKCIDSKYPHTGQSVASASDDIVKAAQQSTVGDAANGASPSKDTNAYPDYVISLLYDR